MFKIVRLLFGESLSAPQNAGVRCQHGFNVNQVPKENAYTISHSENSRTWEGSQVDGNVGCLLLSRTLEGTQVAALTFFVVQFVLQLWHYDPFTYGLGSISPAPFDIVRGQSWGEFVVKGTMILLVTVNTVRYFWSSFFVESDPNFKEIRAYYLPWRASVFEYFLRLTSLGVLYLIPMMMTAQRHAEYFEVLLIILWGCLVLWDYILWQYAVPGSKFRNTAKFWLILEGIGLLLSCLYFSIVRWMPVNEHVLLILCVVILTIMFLVLAGIDIVRNRKAYLHAKSWGHLLLAGLVAGTMILVFKPYL